MNQKTLGFIGGGRIVRIFIEGWRRAGKMPARIVVSEKGRNSFDTPGSIAKKTF